MSTGAQRKVALSAALFFGLVALPGIADAEEPIIAYEVPAGTVGNQAFNGSLGMDFDVNLDIEVTHLGVFDSGSDGLQLPISARLYDRDTLDVLAELQFSPGDDGELVGGSRFKELDPGLDLPAGSRCSIVAEGYGAAEPNGNFGIDIQPAGFFKNAGPCSIFFSGSGRYNGSVVPGAFPETPDGGPPNRYAAGTFRFTPLETPTPRNAIAYVVPAGTMGFQNFDGPVGMDFDVHSDIEIVRLGVFDSGSDGLFRPLKAYLYNRETREALASLDFTLEDPGNLVDGSRFKDLSPALQIPAGFQGTIVAEGYGAEELLANFVNPTPWTFDDGGCAVVAVGTARWGVAPGTFPETVDWGPANRFAAGTFEFEISSVNIEPPNPPTGVTAAPSDGRVVLSWTAPATPPPFDGYNVFLTRPGPRRKLNSALIPVAGFTATGLLNGVEHCFEVTSATVKGLTSDPAPEVCATPATSALPGTRTIAYQTPQGTAGNQASNAPVGLDFQTNARILITQLGAFDDGSDGFGLPITVRLYDTKTRAELAKLEFTPGDPGTLSGGSRFKPLPATIELPPGFEASIVAEGYGEGERNGSSLLGVVPVTFNGGDCVLTPLGGRAGAVDTLGVFPAGFDRAILYAAGTFEYGLKPGEAPPAKDGGVAYRVPQGTAGLQDFGGALGMDFNVVSPVRILRLGVFDDLSDGLMRPITAVLYDRTFQTVLATIEFNSLDSGELVGGSRFKDLGEPIVLVQGFQGTIVASGYGPGELNGNTTLAGLYGPWTVDDGGCLLEFVGGGRWGADPLLFPGTADAGPPNRYAAGTFEFEAVSSGDVPQPPTNLTAAAGPAGTVALTWQAPSGGLTPQGYNVYRTSPLPVEKVNTTLVTGTSFTSPAFVNGVEACFLVRTFAGNLESAPSNEACYTIPGGTRRPGHYIAYEVPQGTIGSQLLAGAIGMDFDADLDIQVTRLGAFDDGSLGFNRTITVRLYDRSTEAELASLEFSPEDPGLLIGGSRFKDVSPPVDLTAGFQGAIVAEGYGDGEAYGVLPGTWYTERGPCAVSYVGTGRTGAEGTFPSSVDVGPFNRFAAGTFEFKPLETPGPATQHGGTAYIVPASTAGNQDFYPGSIGMDFNANGAIRITALGVFDDLSDGLTRTITARLYDRQTEQVLATLEFTPADSGVLEGGSRFKDLSPALELPAGFQGCIVAEGYGVGERNGNAFGPIVWTTDDGGCLLSFVGSGRFHVTPAPPATFPDIFDGGPPNRYAGGTFKFEPSTAVKIFHRGDPNNDGAINITDGIYILNYLFLGGPKPTCLEAANPNDDASINITDGIYVLNYLFLGGPPPVAPGPTASPCGPDRAGSPTNLGCDVYTKC